MSLADDLARTPALVGSPCRVKFLLESFDSKDAAAFTDALDKIRAVPADQRRMRAYPYTSAWLIGVLRANGMTLSRDSLRKHLLKECGCESV